MTQTPTTTTRAYGCKDGQPDELLYECKGYTNLNELQDKLDEYAKANGFSSTYIQIDDDKTGGTYTPGKLTTEDFERMADKLNQQQPN